MRQYAAKTVDQYIANAPEEARATLEVIRNAIRTALPEAQEGIKWGIPFYMYHGMLGGFSVFKQHAGFGFAFALDDAERKFLEQRGYATGKKTVQIRFDQPVPADYIRQSVRKQAELNTAKQTHLMKRPEVRMKRSL